MTPSQKRFSLYIVPFLSVILSGCASLSKDQCMSADWRQIGYTDGTDGQRGSRIDEHARACAEYGIRPNLDDYLQGRQRGLVNYCQAENAFQLGRRGSDQNGADCEPHLKPEFFDQYRRGTEIHEIENDIASRDRYISQNHREIKQSNKRIAEIKADLKKKDLAENKRTDLLTEFDRLVDRKEKLGRNTHYLQVEADRLKLELEHRLRSLGR